MSDDQSRGLGDNGGPPLEKWTAARKLERIKQILETSMSAAQKCIGVGIVAHADTEGVAAEMSTTVLQTIASVRDRETVYRATDRLEKEHIAVKHKIEGRPNTYRVMSARVMQEIEEAFMRTRRVEPDGVVGLNPIGTGDHTRRVEPDGVVGLNPTGTGDHTRRVEPDGVVGLNPTGRVEPVGLNPTGAPPRVGAPARIEPPSGVNISLEDNNPPLTPREIELAAELGVEVNGEAIKAPGFKITYASIEIAVGLNGMSLNRAKRIALGCAVGWASSGTKPQNPAAMVQAAIRSDVNQGQIQDLRIEKAMTGPAALRPPVSAGGETPSQARRKRLERWAEEIEQNNGGRK